MKIRVSIAAAVIALFANFAMAQNWEESANAQWFHDEVKADRTVAAGEDVTAADDVTAGDDITAGDDLTVADDATIGGLLKTTPSSITSTGTATLVVAAGSIILLDASALGYPITTNTLAAPTAAGQWAVLINNGASNSIIITEGTTVDSGGDKTLGPEDVMILFSRSTSAFSAVYHDN